MAVNIVHLQVHALQVHVDQAHVQRHCLMCSHHGSVSLSQVLHCRVAEGEGRLAALQADVQAKVSVMMTHLDGLARREARHAQRRGMGCNVELIEGHALTDSMDT